MPPSNTTVNNLAEQLRWLLSTKPFIPYLTASQTPAIFSQTASITADVPVVATTIGAIEADNVAGSIEVDGGRVIRQVQIEEGANAHVAAAASGPVEASNMVRLRAVGVASPRSDDVYGANVNAATLSTATTDLKGVLGGATKKEPDHVHSSAEGISALSTHAGPSARSATRSPSFEMIDLTADSQNRSTLAGKKRKSSEISRSAPLRETKSKKSNSEDSFDGFTAIDEVSIPQGPLPPYSHSPQRKSRLDHDQPRADRISQAMQADHVAVTHSPKLRPSQTFIDIHKPPLVTGVSEGDQQHVSQSTSVAASSDAKKRKTLERTDSEANGRLQPSKRRVVPDSSDEFEEDEFESNRNSPEVMITSALQAVDESTVIAPQPIQAKPATSDLSKSELAVLDMFSKWSEADVERQMNVVDRTNASLRMQALQYFDRGEAIPPALRAEQQQVSQRRGAIRSLKMSLANLQKIEERRRLLKSELEEAFLNGSDLNDISARNVVLTSELKSEGQQAITFLRICGMLSDAMQLTRPPSSESGAQAVVQATQMPPEVNKSIMKATGDAFTRHQSEKIEQTQDRAHMKELIRPAANLWTPADGIKFDAGRLSAASPMQIEHQGSKSSTSIPIMPNHHAGASQHSLSQHYQDHKTYGDPAANSYHKPDPQYGLSIYEPDQDFDGFGDDDDILIEVGHQYDQAPPTKPASTWVQPQRTPLQEVPGNVQARGLETDNFVVKSTANSQTFRPSTSESRPPATSNIAALNHPWSHDVKKRLLRNFRLTGFRAHQLESINATLAGKDVFVLMPTGGGKSLCYQLPAQVQTGKTRGVTIVISPLISLMEDQVMHLKELGIQAFFLNGSTTAEHKSMVRNVLRNEPNPEDFISLLYVTPEMMSKNVSMVEIFTQLCRRQRLARIVIDEAHCVSQWGHDFRPDYTQLGSLRQKFPGVPFMALTATATENVKMDVVHQLHMKGCEMFKQSFNRPNLYYEVKTKKPKSITGDIASLINGKFKDQCGIIYCLARASCESLAAALRNKHNIAAYHYHAGLSAEERGQIQRAWQAGEHTVIVATIAFGMGIDKPDVRFVIHHSIPKSLEGFYQETGRAGRDGQRSWCYLFWSGADFPKYRKMILESDGSREQQQRQLDMLNVVSQFVENKSDCRRQQVLLYFNENFDRRNCHKACDNCNSTATFETQDFSSYAQQAIAIVRAYWKDTNPRTEEGGLTFGKLLDHFYGKRQLPSRIGDDLPHYAAGSDLDRENCERLVWKLLMIGALQEKNEPNRGGFPQSYIIPGNQVREYDRHGSLKVELEVRADRTPKPKKTKAASKSKKQKQKASIDDDNLGPSTILTSPIQPQTKRSRSKKKSNDAEIEEPDAELRADGYEHDGFVISDDDDAYFEDVQWPEPIAFPKQKPVRTEAQSRGRPVSATYRKTNRPMSPMRKMLSEGLQEELAKFCRHNLVVQFGLRSQPFSDSVLREIAIRLPTTSEEMMEIPAINVDMVSKYGDRLLRLIRNSIHSYESMKEVPHDPNHDIHIDLTAEAEESDDEYAFSDDDDEDFGDEKSHHFVAPDSSPGNHETVGQDAKSRNVESFNARWSASTQPAQPGASNSYVSAPAPAASKFVMPFKAKGKFNQHKQRGSGVVYRKRNNSGTTKSAGKSRAHSAKGTRRTSGSGAAGRAGGGGIRAMIG